jgi:site-specific DNA recombinase
VTSKGLRLLAYGRVSDVRGRSGESFISPEDQMAKCRSYAETYEHEILEEGLDLDVSGGVMTRPVLDRFLAQIRDGKAQGLIVAKLDRFSRSSRGALNALAEIEDAGGVLISVQEQIDSTTAAGRFVRSIFLATAEWERERIGENWTAAQKSAVARGVHIRRHVPPGYQRDLSGKLSPDPKHAKTIARAYQLAAQGTAPARIAEYLTGRGLPSGNNGHTHWRSSRIKRLLANRVYLGEARYGEITNPGAHTPLTEETTWLLAQRQPAATSVSPTSSYLLTGLVRCASCRHSMRPQRARGKTVGSYRCATDTASGRCPHPSSISMNRLEDYMFEEVAERFFDREQRPAEQPDDSEALTALEDARQAVSEVEALRDELHPKAYAQALSKAMTDLDKAERELTSRRSRVDLEGLAEAAMPQVEEEFRRVKAGGRVLDGLDDNAIRLLRATIARDVQAVFVRPAASRSNKLPISDRVRIVWRDEEQLELPRRGERFEPRAYAW